MPERDRAQKAPKRLKALDDRCKLFLLKARTLKRLDELAVIDGAFLQPA